jgi:O-antigen ligase
MRLENSFQNKQIVITQICLVIFVSLMFLKTFAVSLIIPGIVVFITGIFIVLRYPQIVTALFIGFLFIGFSFFKYAEVEFTPAEIMFVVALIGFTSSFINKKSIGTVGSDCKIISITFGIFILYQLLSLIGNLTSLPNVFLVGGFLMVLKFIQYLSVFILMTLILKNSTQINKFIYLLLFFSLLQFPIMIFQHFNGLMNGESINRNVLGTMSYHHGMIGTFMLIPLGLSIGKFFNSPKKETKFFMILFSIIFLIQIILSSTRSALIGLFGALFIFISLKFRFKIQYILVLLIIFLLTGILFYFTPLKELFNATIHSESRNGIDISSLIRLFIWKGGIDFYIDSAWKTKLIGVGTGAYSFITYKQVVAGGLRHAFGGHNNFLTVLCETGIIGLVVFCSFWFIVLKRLLHNHRNPLSISYFYVTIAMLISGLTQETFWVTTAFYHLWTLYMIGLALVLKSASFNGEKNVI